LDEVEPPEPPPTSLDEPWLLLPPDPLPPESPPPAAPPEDAVLLETLPPLLAPPELLEPDCPPDLLDALPLPPPEEPPEPSELCRSGAMQPAKIRKVSARRETLCIRKNLCIDQHLVRGGREPVSSRGPHEDLDAPSNKADMLG
jgi:hypothetical protein